MQSSTSSQNYLMFTNKEMKLEDFFCQLNVEEKNMARNKGVKTFYMVNANIIEYGQSQKTNKSKDKWSSNQKGKGVNLGPRRAIVKKSKKKFQVLASTKTCLGIMLLSA